MVASGYPLNCNLSHNHCIKNKIPPLRVEQRENCKIALLLLLYHAHVPAALITCVIKVKIGLEVGIESNHLKTNFNL